MGSHLADAVLLDLAETGRDHAHLAECARCRAEVAGCREALAAARGLRVPEPSPLFWDLFSARVGAAVRAEGSGRQAARPGWNRIVWRTVAWTAIVLIVGVVVSWRTGWSPGDMAGLVPAADPPVGQQTAGEATPPAAGPEFSEAADVGDTTGDASWSLVADAAADLDLDGATEAGFALPPGSAERAASQLTPDEQRELIQLLRAAVDQTPPQ